MADTRSSPLILGETVRAGATVLSLRGVAKTYSSGTPALAGLSFDVARGSFVSLLGPSGCGKSTVLRLVAGLLAPSAGTISWADGEAPSGRKGEIGFVFQDPTLMPWATVHENVRFPLRLQRISRRRSRDRVMAAIAQVGLSGFEKALPRELSGGMRMRVSLARAMITGPKLLLMDEPFAALDEITRSRLNDDLLRLWAEHRWTILFVTHSVYESAFLSERILVMSPRPGRVVADIPVVGPYPRDEAYRTSWPYNTTCRAVSRALHAAMGDPVAAE